MNGQRIAQRTSIAGLLGAAMLIGSPLIAQADQGKWWDPQGRRPASERRVVRERHEARRDVRRDSRYEHRVRPRFERRWVYVRDGARGPRYRAHRVWVRPFYLHRQQLCVLRPVRYYVGVGVAIGGVRVGARFHDHDGWYGCNFCDARFGDFHSYERHVLRCDDRPDGYRFEIRDWDEDWDDEDAYDRAW